MVILMNFSSGRIFLSSAKPFAFFQTYIYIYKFGTMNTKGKTQKHFFFSFSFFFSQSTYFLVFLHFRDDFSLYSSFFPLFLFRNWFRHRENFFLLCLSILFYFVFVRPFTAFPESVFAIVLIIIKFNCYFCFGVR